jgi:predicted lipoprotein with Yx(FWY)xxD motif
MFRTCSPLIAAALPAASKDAKPGVKTGDGVNSVWHVARD